MSIGVTFGRKNRGERGGGKEGGGEGTKEGGDEVIFKKSAATRPARTRFQGPRADLGRHLVILGEFYQL